MREVVVVEHGRGVELFSVEFRACTVKLCRTRQFPFSKCNLCVEHIICPHCRSTPASIQKTTRTERLVDSVPPKRGSLYCWKESIRVASSTLRAARRVRESVAREMLADMQATYDDHDHDYNYDCGREHLITSLTPNNPRSETDNPWFCRVDFVLRLQPPDTPQDSCKPSPLTNPQTPLFQARDLTSAPLDLFPDLEI
jgi:hypothetical protein